MTTVERACIVQPVGAADEPLFAWRDKFLALCQQYAVDPAAACVRFALSAPGVVAVALNTGRPEQVRPNVALAGVAIPRSFWTAAQAAGIVRPDYAYLP